MARSRMHQDKPASSKSSELSSRLRYFSERSDAITETVRHLVEIESPSDVKAAVDRLGAFLASRFEQLGGRAKFHPTPGFGDHLQGDFPAARKREPVLVLGHLGYGYSHSTPFPMAC